ncbi:MAG: S8 family serine peptidase [Halobacteriales archaeon]|nr:S8 family serine peptidase [Halobacteriales archaeon]
MHPKWKISPNLKQKLGSGDVDDRTNVLVQSLGSVSHPHLNNAGKNLYQGNLTRPQIRALQNNPLVNWIERNKPEEISVSEGRKLSGSGGNINGPPDNLNGDGVRVGVLDTGFTQSRNSHSHFDGVSVVYSRDWVDGGDPEDPDFSPGFGDVDHGIHVAGTIAGQGVPDSIVNGKSTDRLIKGVAPEATLVISRVFDTSGLSHLPNDYSDAYQEVHDDGADIISNSWGHSSTTYDLGAEQTDRWANNHQDTLLVFANGNGALNSPGLSKNVLSVGAYHDGTDAGGTASSISRDLTDQITDLNDISQPDSNQVKPDINAPGKNITAPLNQDGTYAGYNGTSMATPHVSGAAALYKEEYPSAGAAQIKAALVGSTNPVRNPNNYAEGWGGLDIRDAIYNNQYESNSKTLSGTVTRAVNEVDTFNVDVSNDAEKVEVSLNWIDEEGSAMSTDPLVNGFELCAGPQSNPRKHCDDGDRDNDGDGDGTVRKLSVEPQQTGTWQITVDSALGLLQTQQSYAGSFEVVTEEPQLSVDTTDVTITEGETGVSLVDISGEGAPVSGIYTKLSSIPSDLDLCEQEDEATVVGDLSHGYNTALTPCFTSTTPGTYNLDLEVQATNLPNRNNNEITKQIQVTVEDDDTSPPSFSNPSSPKLDDSSSSDYTIGADVSDDTGVDQSTVEFRYKFGSGGSWSSWLSYSSNSVDGSGNGRYNFDIPRSTWIDNVGKKVIWQVRATDSDDDITSTGTSDEFEGNRITDDDTNPPSISNVNVQEHNGDGDGVIEDDEQVKIEWDTSDPSGISDTGAEVEGDEKGLQDDDGDSQYFITSEITEVNDVDYRIFSTDDDNDRSGDQETAEVTDTFVAQDDDTTPPSFGSHDDTGDTTAGSYFFEIEITDSESGVKDDSTTPTIYFNYGSSSFSTSNADGSATADLDSGDTYRATIDVPESREGQTIYWKAEAVDADDDRDNDGASATSTTFTGGTIQDDDTTPPTLSNITFDSSKPSDQDVSVQADITDSSGIGSATIDFEYPNGSTGAVSMSQSSGDTWQGAIPAAGDENEGDTLTFTITAEDNDNSPESTTSSQKSVSITDDDTAPPSITNIQLTEESSPNNNGQFESHEQINVSWQVDDKSDVAVDFTLDGTPKSVSQNGDTYFVILGPLSSGSYSYQISATDQDNTPESSSTSDSFTVEENQAPSVTVDSPNGGEIVGITTQIEWSSSDPENDSLTFDVEYSDDGGSTWNPIQQDATGSSISWDTSGLVEGSNYLVRVTADDTDKTDQDTSDSTFTLDNTPPPELSPTASPTGWNQSVTVSWDAVTDGGSGIDHYEYQLDSTTGSWNNVGTDTSVTLTESGRHTVYVRAVDRAGNAGPTNSTEVQIDNLPPTTSASLSGTAGDNGWFTSNVSVTLSATDQPTSDDNSGVDTTQYSIDGGSFTVGTSFMVTGDGTHPISFFSTDVAGNQESTNTREVKIDSQQPGEPAPTAPDGVLSNPTVSWDPVSDATSGVDHYQVSIDGGTWQDIGDTSYQDSSLPDGTHTIGVRAVDTAGNIGPSNSTQIDVDTTAPPAPTVTGPSGWTNDTTPTISWSSVSDATTGVDHYEMNVGGSGWTDVGLTTSTTLSTLSSGEHMVEVRAVDGVGNEGDSGNTTVKIDITAPRITISEPAYEELITNRTNVTVNGTATDARSGLERVEVSTDAGSNWTTVSSQGGPFSDWSFDWEIDDSNVEDELRVRAVDDLSNTRTEVHVVLTQRRTGCVDRRDAGRGEMDEACPEERGEDGSVDRRDKGRGEETDGGSRHNRGRGGGRDGGSGRSGRGR